MAGQALEKEGDKKKTEYISKTKTREFIAHALASSSCPSLFQGEVRTYHPSTMSGSGSRDGKQMCVESR
jgi:hypothetical protein